MTVEAHNAPHNIIDAIGAVCRRAAASPICTLAAFLDVLLSLDSRGEGASSRRTRPLPELFSGGRGAAVPREVTRSHQYLNRCHRVLCAPASLRSPRRFFPAG